MDRILSRRSFLSSTLATASVSGWLNVLAGHARGTEKSGRRPKSCILLWMTGGPSQLETFDLKPDGPADKRGDFRPISTNVTGIQISEHLPRLSRCAHQFAILRSMSTGVARPPHNLAMRTMRLFQSNPLDPVARPNLGSIVSAQRGTVGDLPNFVLLGLPPGLRNSDTTAGFLGSQHAPWIVSENLQGIDHRDSPVDRSVLDRRLSLLGEIDDDFGRAFRTRAAEAHRANYHAALRLMATPLGTAFQLDRESDRLRDRYGRSAFGQRCLLARRLVEAGVPFVEVPMGRDNGDGLWDTHTDNFNRTRTMSSELDIAFSALLQDLADRGLLDETLIIWMGEMGRTPEITQSNAGREHFVSAWSIVLAGGGIRTGQAVGRTSADGEEVVDRPISAQDFLATVGRALSLDLQREYDTRTGRPAVENTAADNRISLVDAKARIGREWF